MKSVIISTKVCIFSIYNKNYNHLFNLEIVGFRQDWNTYCLKYQYKHVRKIASLEILQTKKKEDQLIFICQKWCYSFKCNLGENHFGC